MSIWRKAFWTLVWLSSLGWNFACSDGHEMICYPGLYQCGGQEGNLLQYCDSSTKRWETLYNCEELGKVCEGGACTNPDGDTDNDAEPETDEANPTDGDEPESCQNDADCTESQLCVEQTCVAAGGQRVDLDAGDSKLVYRHDTGRVSIYDADGRPILQNAVALVELEGLGEAATVLSTDADRVRSLDRKQERDRLGIADRLTVTVSGEEDEPDLLWQISAYFEEGFYTFKLRLANNTGERIWLAKSIPLRTSPDQEGGLYLGDDPAHHRILENGSFGIVDHVVAIHPGDVEPDSFLQAAAPGDYIGHSVSDWNHAVVDLDSPAVWIAGALSFEATTPVVNLSYSPGQAPAASDGRAGFHYFSLEGAYLPELKPVDDQTVAASELMYVHPSETDVFEGLERYTGKVKQWLDITLWQERAPGNRVPNGWNSWSGSGGTGGYGTGIDETIILENLDIMATQLRDWGFDWFQVDDGYEPAYGDWTWRSDRFPHGPAWLADQIRQRGLKPGLWIAPFTPDPDSQLATEHPDWLADKTEAGLLLSSSYELLDLTNPEVKTYISDLFTTFRQDWGFEWLKMDFAYWALFGTHFHDPTKTREEAWREAVGLIREAIGDDTFFLMVAIMGTNYGLVDADRITLDNAPIWDWAPGVSDDDPLNQQGFKPTMRTVSRRYYLHNRVWINHPDLLLFRSNTRDESWPRVTLNESKAFATFVGLSGGIVKLGDRLVDLSATEINVIRKLVPIYDKGARPLDLMQREFAEQWHLKVDYTLDGYDEVYDLIGLFNWGANRDLTTNPYSDIPDDGAARNVELDLRELGLAAGQPYLAYEFWSQSFLGELTNRLTAEVASHSAQVISLRRKLGVPQFLGFNRQISMGGTVLKSSSWDDTSATLTLVMDVAVDTPEAPFTYQNAFYVPEGYVFDEAAYSGVGLKFNEETTDGGGRVLRVNFVPQSTGELTMALTFERE